MKPAEFTEVQRFKTWWAWTAAAAMNVLFIYALVQQVFLGKPFGTKPAPDAVLIFIESIVFLFLLFLFSIRLKTRIDHSGIRYRFYPFQFKETYIEWHELKDAYIREYDSFYEYGGWGIRAGGSKFGKAVNMSSSSGRGLQLQFNNGKLLLIGTARPDELKQVIESVTVAGKINRGI